MRGLAAIVREENLGEITLEQDGVRVYLRSRRAAAPLSASALSAPAIAASEFTFDPAASDYDAEAAPVGEAASTIAAFTPIVSPMVGSFYRAKSPDEPPFVEVGERVEIGQIVGLVEAMKTFNEITSEIEGEIVAIPAQTGHLVETGDALVLVAT